MTFHLRLSVFIPFLLTACSFNDRKESAGTVLELKHDKDAATMSVYRSDGTGPLLVQHAKEGIRPYIHPIVAPDGNGELTEFSPAHHKHQTGLYWGLKEVNSRDYFMNWKADYWRRVSAEALTESGSAVQWRTTYRLLDEKGDSILTETQTWTFQEANGKYYLDLTWSGLAHSDVTMGKFYVGGLFLRMPWHEGIEGEAVNAAGQRNGEAEGQRAIWNDVGIRVAGRPDMGHIAILDHPDNKGFPVPWRVDNELGVGPSRQILGDWTIPEGASEEIRYRLIVYTGARDGEFIDAMWKEYVCE